MRDCVPEKQTVKRCLLLFNSNGLCNPSTALTNNMNIENYHRQQPKQQQTLPEPTNIKPPKNNNNNSNNRTRHVDSDTCQQTLDSIAMKDEVKQFAACLPLLKHHRHQTQMFSCRGSRTGSSHHQCVQWTACSVDRSRYPTESWTDTKHTTHFQWRCNRWYCWCYQVISPELVIIWLSSRKRQQDR